VANLIERCCRHATEFAEGLQAAGYQILNDVVLNQVLVKFKTDELTERIIKRVQDDGTCWCGGTQWQSHTAMRISVSSWATKAADVKQSLDAIIRIAAQEEAA
jgi:glutamate/tyrosine decarboxylase-like PLP-dependent enzyme